jgi:hypothetical protein
MPEPQTVNSQVVNALSVLGHRTMDRDVVLASGSGKAFQSVAQSAAIAIQDATDTLRNVSTIASTAAGVALAQYVATLMPEYKDVITESQTMMTNAVANFKAVGEEATKVVNNFPFGTIPKAPGDGGAQ